MKNNFTLKTTFLIVLFLSAFSAISQERTCGMVEYMDEQMQNPEFAREYQENQAKFKAKLQEILANGEVGMRQGTSITIPVAVHYPSGNEADRACLVALAQNQIDILNEDYTATNSDISLWSGASSNYPGTNTGPMDVTFCLAVSNHPTGLDPELIEGQPCVTIGYDFGGGNNFDSNWAGYMNFVVRPLGGGTLGFSPLGGSVAAGYAVTIDDNAFGSGAGCAGSGVVPGAPFNLGRTTTHELGHFYNLNHTFTGSCGSDDGISDTPNISNPNYGCPSPGSVAACVAGQYALTMNYMDYTNDACMYMFSAGQATVAEAYLTGVLQAQFVQNVCVEPDPGFSIVANDSPVSSCPTFDTEAVFNLTYNTILDFSEVTTFSASGLPAGATVSFSPSSMSATGDFTMTIGNLGSTAQGEYTITVTGTSLSVTESTDVLLKNTCTTIECTNYASPQNLNLAIADGSGGTPGTPYVQHVINVPDAGAIESMTVNVDITHTWISDLLVRITHPDGSTFVDVWAGNCNDAGYVNMNITFDDNGGVITCGSPTNGTFSPDSPLSAFNGLEGQGNWTILVADFFAQDTGQLNDWAIDICTEQPLSINDFEFEGFALFPNPNNGSFTVNLNSVSQNPITVEVFDIRGRSIYRNRYNNVSGAFSEEVNLSNAQAGMYLVNVTDGERKVTKKIIVE